MRIIAFLGSKFAIVDKEEDANVLATRQGYSEKEYNLRKERHSQSIPNTEVIFSMAKFALSSTKTS